MMNGNQIEHDNETLKQFVLSLLTLRTGLACYTFCVCDERAYFVAFRQVQRQSRVYLNAYSWLVYIIYIYR